MKVKVDRDLCIGCGTCVAVCPKVFSIDEEGKSIIAKKDGIKIKDWANDTELDDAAQNIQTAVDSCPTKAILIEK